MGMRDALKSAGVSSLVVSPGDVCIVKDESVVIPETTPEKRKYHSSGRTCVVLTTAALSKRVLFPVISIAPTSSQVHLKDESDFDLKANPQNGLDVDSLVMVAHIQPVRKVDLIKKIGELSQTEWDDLTAHIMWYFDIT
jgi:mRNA-degrading endonuclease toxin of MazEF toxin-antitoxin module